VSSRLRHGKRLPLVAAEVSAPDGDVSQPGPRAAWLLSASLFVPLRTNEPKFVARGERDIRTRRPSRFAKAEFLRHRLASQPVWPDPDSGALNAATVSPSRSSRCPSSRRARRARLPLWTITGSESKCLPVRLPVAVG